MPRQIQEELARKTRQGKRGWLKRQTGPGGDDKKTDSARRVWLKRQTGPGGSG